MTEFNPNPPEQPAAYPTPVAGAEPIPALPYTGWNTSPQQGRPGILTAVSVISIVVACVSFLGSLVSGCQSGGLYMVSKMSGAMAAAATAPSTTTTTTTIGGVTSYSTHVTTVQSPFTPAAPVATTEPSAIADPTTEPTTEPATASSTSALTASEIAGAVQRAQAVTGNKLNAAQLSALTTALQDPNQTLIAPGTAWSPVRSGNVGPDGSAFIMFSGGFASMDAKGQLQQNNLNMPNFKVSGMVAALAALDAVVCLGLAIFLFVAAIIVMRSSPAGRKMHLIYAVLKIPLAIVGGVVLGKMYSEFYGSMGAAIPGGTSAMQSMAYMWAMGAAVIALIYPIALLIVMNTRSVRDYYRPGATPLPA